MFHQSADCRGIYFAVTFRNRVNIKNVELCGHTGLSEIRVIVRELVSLRYQSVPICMCLQAFSCSGIHGYKNCALHGRQILFDSVINMSIPVNIHECVMFAKIA